MFDFKKLGRNSYKKSPCTIQHCTRSWPPAVRGLHFWSVTGPSVGLGGDQKQPGQDKTGVAGDTGRFTGKEKGSTTLPHIQYTLYSIQLAYLQVTSYSTWH